MSKILLSGIFLSQWCENEISIETVLIEDSLVEPLNFEDFIEEKKKVNFSCIEDWPNSSDLLCWNCALRFEGRPWFIPISWTEQAVEGQTPYKISDNFPDAKNKKKKNCIKPYGNFCSANCTVAFLDETRDISNSLKPNYLTMIYLLYEKFFGKKIKYIKPAPFKHSMKDYCGPSGITAEQYKLMIFSNKIN